MNCTPTRSTSIAMTEVDKNRMDDDKYVQNKAEEIGLINVWAYHCYRCNYTWLPRDFDFNWYLQNGKTDDYDWGPDLFYREARCKSRSWKIPIALRKRKLHPIFVVLPDMVDKMMYQHA